MRNKGQIAAAVDFGTREIRVLIGRQDPEGAIEIIGHGVAPGHGCVSQGVIQDRNAAQVALATALKAAEKEAHVKTSTLFCGVNGKNVETFVREGNVQIERGIVEPEHMAEARDIASRDILAPGKRVTSSISAQEWYVDDMRVADPLGIRAHVLKTRVHFARLPGVIEDNILSCIESQRRELEDLIFLPLAAALGCLTPEDMELGVGVLDIGRSTTGLVVYRDYRIVGSHVLEWGSYHITRDVAAGLQVSFEEADQLILEYGISDEFLEHEIYEEEDETNSKDDADERTARIKLKSVVPGAPSTVDRRELDLIIFERAKELMIKVRQHLHSRGLSKCLVRGVVLTGGASVIRNHVQLAEAVFQTPCRVGHPNSVQIHLHDVHGPEYAAAVGIIRHAFEYRAAAKRGKMEPRGPLVSGIRRLGRFFRKYFI